jgi:hypothetical protein
MKPELFAILWNYNVINKYVAKDQSKLLKVSEMYCRPRGLGLTIG